MSVIVPFYNSERYIAQCIQALLSQDYPLDRYEIIMVNNNSTDRSADIVSQHPRIKLLSERRQGSYAARNRGLADATGEVIAFTDADCRPASDWLRELENALRAPGVEIVVGSHQFNRSSRLLTMLEEYENEKKDYVFSSGIGALYYGHTNNMAVTRRLLDQEGHFVRVGRGADTMFVRRCVEKYSLSIVRYAPRASVEHLEIDSVGKYFEKMFIYGGSSRRVDRARYAQPLNSSERAAIYLRVVRRHGYSWRRSISFLMLLLVGLGYWTAGSVNAAWRLRRRPK
jgi:glycosyltransferase involved in cell wall biosynthesis